MTQPTTQLTHEALTSMTDDQIVQARADGRLNVLLGMDPAEAELLTRAKTSNLTAADEQALNRLHQYELITAAHREGRINLTKEK